MRRDCSRRSHVVVAIADIEEVISIPTAAANAACS